MGSRVGRRGIPLRPPGPVHDPGRRPDPETLTAAIHDDDRDPLRREVDRPWAGGLPWWGPCLRPIADGQASIQAASAREGRPGRGTAGRGPTPDEDRASLRDP